MQIAARRYDTAEPMELTLNGGRIAQMRPLAVDDPDDLPFVAPGFVDLQVNGYGGYDFTSADLTVDAVREVCVALARFGVTAFCPTVTTQSHERMVQSLRTIAKACDEDATVSARVAGVHVEGPFISPEDGPRGAHPAEHVRPPSWDEFQAWQDAAGGRIKIVTLAPEYDEAPDFIRRITDAGVVAAIGHTAADSEQIATAVDAGARLSTHLGNGAHGTIRRHPNYIWDQLANDRLLASLIVDGHHLPSAVVKSMVRAKTPARCILVSDITALAGLPPGDYRGTPLGDVELLESGKLVVAGQRQYLAGASRPINVNIARMIQDGEVTLAETVEMASARPAELVGCEVGRLEVGAAADLVVFDEKRIDGVSTELRIQMTIKGGNAS